MLLQHPVSVVSRNGTHPDSSSKFSARLRIVGAIVLALGITAAGIVYCIGTRGSHSDDLDMIGYKRSESRQMGVLFGQSGVIIDDLLDDLKRPGTQAAIIAGISVLVACGCFYLARPVESDEEDS